MRQTQTTFPSIVEDIHNEISGKQWMCGFPDKMFIATSGNLIVAVYGDEELVNTFRDKLCRGGCKLYRRL